MAGSTNFRVLGRSIAGAALFMAAGLLVWVVVTIPHTSTSARPPAKLVPAVESSLPGTPRAIATPADLGRATSHPTKVKPKIIVPAASSFVTALCNSPIYQLQLNTSQVRINTCAEAGPTFYGYDSFTHDDQSQFTVPSGPNAQFTTTWWSGSGPSNPGPKPGGPYMSVFWGHTGIGETAVFNDLPGLRLGDQAFVRTSTGVIYRYSLCTISPPLPKNSPVTLHDELAHHPACANMAWATCSGQVDASLESHYDNTLYFFKFDGVA